MSFFALTAEPSVRVRLQPGWTLAKSRDKPAFVLAGPRGETPPVAAWAEDFQAAGALLAEGAPLSELRDAVVRLGGGQRGAAWMLFLQNLNRWGFVEFPLVDETGERATALPQWQGWAPRLAPESLPPHRELDRFACLRRDSGGWLVESPLCGARLRLADLSALDAPVVRRALAGAGFLAAPPADAARRDALAQWEFHDLSFHFHNRRGFHRDPCGGVYAHIGRIAPPPARRPPWPGEPIPLARAPDDSGESFAAVLERRRSVRHYDEERPISLRDLGALLDRAARATDFRAVSVGNDDGKTSSFEISTRPYPDGGASYELEIYPAVARCEGLEPGLYHYDAAGHALTRVSGRTPDVDGMFVDAHFATGGIAKPQVVLAIAARFARVMWKYRSIAYGLILRNTGALYQTLYLAATELGLSPCGVGSGDAARFARATGLDPLVEGTVGDFILGGRPGPVPPDPRLPGAGGRE